MLRRKRQPPSLLFSGQQLNGQDDEADEKDKNTDAVYPVHIPDPFVFWPVRVFFPQVEVF